MGHVPWEDYRTYMYIYELRPLAPHRQIEDDKFGSQKSTEAT
jgi:hypothetical protein